MSIKDLKYSKYFECVKSVFVLSLIIIVGVCICFILNFGWSSLFFWVMCTINAEVLRKMFNLCTEIAKIEHIERGNRMRSKPSIYSKWSTFIPYIYRDHRYGQIFSVWMWFTSSLAYILFAVYDIVGYLPFYSTWEMFYSIIRIFTIILFVYLSMFKRVIKAASEYLAFI